MHINDDGTVIVGDAKAAKDVIKALESELAVWQAQLDDANTNIANVTAQIAAIQTNPKVVAALEAEAAAKAAEEAAAAAAALEAPVEPPVGEMPV